MPRQERERRYIVDYMKARFPDMNWMLNVGLGPIPEELVNRYGLNQAAALFRPTRPRVDAVRWEDGKYILIEAKLRDMKAGIGDLTYYRAMAAKTPDLPYYNGQPIVCRLAIPFNLEWVKWVANEAGVEIDIFWIDWVGDYVKERQHYFTSEYRIARNEKMELRKVLGVD